MNQVDKISKEALNLLKYAKDTAVTNLASANSNGQLEYKLTDEQLLSVVSLLDSSLSQGYQKALPSFQSKVDSLIGKETETRKKK